MSGRVFSVEALATLAEIYPGRAGKLTHRLLDHPLFELDALVALSRRMRPEHVEHNLADLPIGVDPAAIPANGLSPADTIRSIERNGSWMVLKFVEQDPLYRALLESLIAELAPVATPRTGAMLTLESFIFVSSPGAVTPFHFDPEHNILLQLRGRKTMTVFPPHDDRIAAGALHEAFHLGEGHRNLPFDPAFADRGRAIEIGPGEAIYVPVKAPHWVKNGAEPSVSFSITWRSEWSYAEADAHAMNRVLRRIGLNPAPPRAFPYRNTAKSIAYRAIRRARRAIGAE